MQDIFSSTIIGLLGLVALFVIGSRYRTDELPLLVVAYAGHVAAGFAQVLITGSLYGSGDIFGYARRGEELSAALSLDFRGMGWELLKLLFHQDAILPFTMSGIGSSTGTMSALAGFTNYFTGGEIYAGCVLFGVLGFYGKLAAYEVFRQTFPVALHRRLLIANLLVPSVVFWSAGLLKEAVAIVGLGPMMLGIHRLLKGKTLSALLLIILGGTTVALVKAYILFAFVVSSVVWVYAARAWKGTAPRLRPVHLALGLGVSVLALAGLGRLFPQYALDTLAEQAAYHQEVGQRVRGGSTYVLMSDPADASIAKQLLYAPVGLLTSLYRPFVFEGTNAQMLGNSLETTALLAMSLRVLWRVRLRSIWRLLISSPLALFALVFVIVFGVAVGLATTNLGTLSRYRVPLVPLFASLLVLMLGQQEPRRSPKEAPPPQVGPRLQARHPLPHRQRAKAFKLA
jgi:hypothetical protein